MFPTRKHATTPSGVALMLQGCLFQGSFFQYLLYFEYLIILCRYQNIFRILIWLLFLVVYSQAGTLLCSFVWCFSNPPPYTVREPLDKIDVRHSTFDAWEVILYVMALSFLLEGKCHLSSNNFKADLRVSQTLSRSINPCSGRF